MNQTVVTYLHKFTLHALTLPTEVSMTGGWIIGGIKGMPWQYEVGALDAPEMLACGSHKMIGEGKFCYPAPTINWRP